MTILFPRVETGGRDVLVRELVAQGANVVEVPAYESDCAQEMPDEILSALQHGKIDVVTFASSKTVRCFHQLLSAKRQEAEVGSQETNSSSPFPLPTVASIGPQTSATCRELLGRVDVEAEDYTLEGLIQAIVKWVTEVDK